MYDAKQMFELGIFKPGDYWINNLDYPGYLFSDDGRVVSLLKKKPRLLKPIKMGEYKGLQLKHKDGSIKKQYHHRLIAESFIGPCPDGLECCHNDGDRNNNSSRNLRWDTPAMNMADQIAHGRTQFGEKNYNSKLTENKVLEMRKLRKLTGQSHMAIAKKFGVSTMTAYRAIEKKSWRHI